jgi:hypothetical protein
VAQIDDLKVHFKTPLGGTPHSFSFPVYEKTICCVNKDVATLKNSLCAESFAENLKKFFSDMTA